MEQVNILIIDRSASFCERLKAFLQKSISINEVFATTSIEEGMRILTSNNINIVLLDIMFPEYENQPVLRIVLSIKVIPVIIVAEATVDQMAKTVTAMSNGAVDFIKKVDIQHAELVDEFERGLMLKLVDVTKANRLRSIAKKLKDNPLNNETFKKQPTVQITTEITPKNVLKKEVIVVIGTSTGGPRALHQVIQQIPKDFNYPILIVQHMPAGFTKSLALRLNNIGNIRVKEAVDGERIHKGTAYLAPGNYHMQVITKQEQLFVQLTQDNSHLPHRPSVDLMFESVAKLTELHKVAVVLTGMGRDGTNGVIEIKTREKEAIILVESKETAVIDGMPKSAYDTNLATKVLRIEKVGSAIVEYIKKRGN